MASRTINIPATTNLDADELTSGTVPFARLSVGTGSTQSALTGNFLSSTLYLMSRAGSALYAAGRLAGFAVFPSYITNDQATLLATAA